MLQFNTRFKLKIFTRRFILNFLCLAALIILKKWHLQQDGVGGGHGVGGGVGAGSGVGDGGGVCVGGDWYQGSYWSLKTK